MHDEPVHPYCLLPPGLSYGFRLLLLHALLLLCESLPNLQNFVHAALVAAEDWPSLDGTHWTHRSRGLMTWYLVGFCCMPVW